MRVTTENALVTQLLKNPEIAPFLMFTTVTPLWVVRVHPDLANEAKRQDREAEEDAQADRVTLARLNVELGLTPFGDQLPPDAHLDASHTPDVAIPPQDEWERFWGGESPTERGRVPRSVFAPRR